MTPQPYTVPVPDGAVRAVLRRECVLFYDSDGDALGHVHKAQPRAADLLANGLHRAGWRPAPGDPGAWLPGGAP